MEQAKKKRLGTIQTHNGKKPMDTFSSDETFKLKKNKWLLTFILSKIFFLFSEKLKKGLVFSSEVLSIELIL